MHDIYAVQQAANLLAQRAGLTVKFQPQRGFATTMDGVLHIQQPRADFSDADLRVWRNGVAHEIGHWLPENRDIFPLLKARQVSTSTVFGACLNIVDDVRNDMLRCEVYPGTKADKVFCTEYLISTLWLDKVRNPAPDHSVGDDIVNAMVAGSVAVTAMLDTSLAATYDMLHKALPEHVQAWCDEMDSAGWLDRWAMLENAEQEYQFVSDILRDLFKVTPNETGESEHKQPGEDAKDGDPADDGDSDTKSGKATKGKGDKDGEDAEGKLRITVPYEKLSGEHDEAAQNHEVRIDYDSYEEMHEYVRRGPDDTRVGPADKILSGRSDWDNATKDAMNTFSVDTLANQARMYLQAETRKRIQPNQRAGKLDMRKLHKVVTYTGSNVPAVFRTVEQKHAIETAVSILIDASGSMTWGGKYAIASAAGFGMASICQTLNIPCEIAGFTDTYEFNAHAVIKDFAERLNPEKFLSRVAVLGGTMMNNADGDSILIAYHRILQRKEAKKLLIVMSDGSPCAENPGDCYKWTQQVVKGIEQSKHVDIMGVGILDGNVKLIYHNNQVIETAAQIPQALISILRDNVISK